MSTVRAVQEVATLDEFLADPLVVDELAEVIHRLGEGDLEHGVRGVNGSIRSVRIKARDGWGPKRTRLNDDDAARLILAAWRSYRP